MQQMLPQLLSSQHTVSTLSSDPAGADSRKPEQGAHVFALMTIQPHVEMEFATNIHQTSHVTHVTMTLAPNVTHNHLVKGRPLFHALNTHAHTAHALHLPGVWDSCTCKPCATST
jgi:hypothetical protein